MNPFSEGYLCRGKQAGIHKRSLPCQKWRKNLPCTTVTRENVSYKMYQANALLSMCNALLMNTTCISLKYGSLPGAMRLVFVHI